MNSSPQFPKLGVSACIWRKDKVLLVQRAKPPAGLWAFPGGHVEAGETLEEAVARELREETGLAAQFSGLLGLYDIIRRDAQGQVTVHYVIACYLGVANEGDPVAASDAMAVEWADPLKLGNYRLAPNMADAIAKAHAAMSG